MLNQRETEILKLVSEGHSYKELAYKTKLSIPSINFYIRSAKNKLKAKNICHAVVLFIKLG